MSTYYDLGCADCGGSAGFHWNHGNNQLAHLWAHRHAFMALSAMVREADERHTYIDLNLQFLSGNSPSIEELGTFVTAHDTHDVRPKDEYGRWDNQCRKNVKCGECSGFRPCVLELNHADPCLREPE